jgi:hypothetical protein
MKAANSRSHLSVIPDEQGRLMRSPMSIRTMNTAQTMETDNTTPKANRATSSIRRPASTISKRSGTVAHEYMRRHEVPAPLHGGHRYKGTYRGAPVMDDFDMVSRDDGDDPDASFEGLENVRGKSWSSSSGLGADQAACCGGKHLVGEHHNHEHGEVSKDVRRTPKRPATPSNSIRAWSMRSRRQSETSRKASSIFRRGDDESVRTRSAMDHNDESMRTISPAPRNAS